jgi:hypothetical protein
MKHDDEGLLGDLGLVEGVGDLLTEVTEGLDVWIHVPARSVLRLCLLRDKPTSFFNHIVAGRPKFCESKRDREGRIVEASRCSYCRGECGAKKRYVYTVLDLSRGSGHLLDLAPHTALEIESSCNQTGIHLGMVFDFRKEGSVVNGRIRAKWTGTMLSEKDLPLGPDLVQVFSKMRSEQLADDLWKGGALRAAGSV